MFKKRDKSKEKDPNILREVADRVSDITSQINNLDISSEQPILIEDEVSDTPRYRPRSMSPPSARTTMPSRSGSRDRHSINEEISNLNEMLKNLKKDPNFQTTLTDGLGRILLEIQVQLNEIHKNIGLPCTKDTDDLCVDYTEYLKDFKHNIDRKLTNNNENVDYDLDNRIELAVKKINKEKLNRINHNSAETIFPPTSYSPVETMRGNDHKISQVQTYFPFRHKFKGSGYEPAITQWLDNMNDGQDICNISEKEFLTVMRKCTTGKAYEEICAMIDSKLGIPQIYQALLSKYDTRERPETAKKKLENYVPPSNATLKSIQGDIMELGLRSKLLYAKASQVMAYNHDTIKSLIKALPEANHPDAYRVLDELNSHNEGYPDFADFCTALSRYEVAINNNLRKSGQSRSSFSKPNFQRPYTSSKPNLAKKYNKIKAIQAKPTNQEIWSYLEKQRERPPFVIFENQIDRQKNFRSKEHNNFTPNNNNYRPTNNNNYNRNYNGYNQKNRSADRYQKTGSFRNNLSNPNKMELGIRGRHACTLCGGNNHQASSGCFRMRNDKGRIVFCPPSQAPCSRCERETNKTLYHPEVLCFRRPIMKQFLSEGKYKYPTPEERQQLKNFIENSGRAQ